MPAESGLEALVVGGRAMVWINVPSTVVVMLALFGILGVGALVVLYGTIVRNRWGINLSALSCPRCGAPAPRARKPRTAAQALWGGWSCAVCGAEVDKWGREQASSSADLRC